MNIKLLFFLLISFISVEASEKKICDLCNEKVIRSLFRFHLWNNHKVLIPGIEKYICPYPECERKAFLNYDRHCFVHTGERPYQCEQCSMAFADQTTLINHVRRHTGDKPYGCNICKRNFRQRGQLEQHLVREAAAGLCLMKESKKAGDGLLALQDASV